MHAADGLGLQTPRRWDCDEALFANKELSVAPVDALREKAGDPNEECEGVAKRQRPEFAAQQTIAHSGRAYDPGHHPAQNHVSSNICGGDGGGRCQDGSEHSPRQTLRENQAEMSPGARIADAEIPTNLMAKSGGQPLGRIDDGNGELAEIDAMAVGGEAIAEFVVVAKIIDQRFEAADFSEMLFSGRHHGAQHEIERAIAEEPRDEDARREVGAIAESFESGGKALVGQTAVEAGDPAYSRDREMARRSRGGSPARRERHYR